MKIDFPIGSGGLLENVSNWTMEPDLEGPWGESLAVTTSTLPETNITPENGGPHGKRRFLLNTHHFKGIC